MLKGRHVTLVPLDASHAVDLFAAASRPEIWRHMPVRGFTALADLERWIGEAQASAENGREEPYAIVDNATGTAIGSTRFLDIRPAERALEIGWTWIAPAHQRTAVNSEAKYLLLRDAFETRDVVRVAFFTNAENGRSRASLVRFATYEGTLRLHRARAIDNFERSSAVYSVIAPEWRKVRTILEGKISRRPRASYP
ncbi:MAG: GNAT family protein [Vulcanimicrobiaceae bacterium]